MALGMTAIKKGRSPGNASVIALFTWHYAVKDTVSSPAGAGGALIHSQGVQQIRGDQRRAATRGAPQATKNAAHTQVAITRRRDEQPRRGRELHVPENERSLLSQPDL